MANSNLQPMSFNVGTRLRHQHVTARIGEGGMGQVTFWWHLTHPDGEVSILWAGNAMVTSNRGAQLLSVLPEGEENAPGNIFIGHGLQPGTAGSVTAQLWVRTHGPASNDPDVLERQLTTPFGGCTDTRNPEPAPDDYPCWNPQRAVF